MSDLRQVIKGRNKRGGGGGDGSGRFDPDNFEPIRRTVSRHGRVEVRVGARSVERSRSRSPNAASSRETERGNCSEWSFRSRGSRESRCSSDGGRRSRTSTSPAGRRPSSTWRPASPLPYQRYYSKSGGKDGGEENDAVERERDKILGSSKEPMARDVLDTADLDAISDEDSMGGEGNPNPEAVEQELEAVSDGSVGGKEANVTGEYDLVSDAELKDTSVVKEDNEGLDQISISDLGSKNSKEEDNVSLGSLESVGADGLHPLQTSDISADEGDVVGALHPPVESGSSSVMRVAEGKSELSEFHPPSVRWFDLPEQVRRQKSDSSRDGREYWAPQDHRRESASSGPSSSYQRDSLDNRERRDRYEERQRSKAKGAGQRERHHRDNRVGRDELEGGRKVERHRYGGHRGRDEDHEDYSFSKRSPPRGQRSEGSRSPDGYSRNRREALPRPNPPDPGSRTRVVQNPETMKVKKVKPCLICQGTDHMAKECKDLKCYRCNQMGHFAKECPNPAAPRTPAATAAPQGDGLEQQQQRQTTRSDRQGQCYNCEEYGHNIKQCQYLTCRKCGGQGHFAKECTNPPRMNMIMNSASIAPPSYSIDYGHASTSAGPEQRGQPRPQLSTLPPPPPPSFKLNEDVGFSRRGGASSSSRFPSRRPGSLLEHFVLQLRERGVSGTDVAVLAEEMMTTWRKAGHGEESLGALRDRRGPLPGGGASALRLSLVGALDSLQGSQIPLSVNVSRLLDDTLDYLMLPPPLPPASNAQRGPPAPPNLNLLGHQPPPSSGPPVPPSMSLLAFSSAPSELARSMNRFRDLVAGLRDGATRRDNRQEFDARMRSLDPFRVYLAGKMFSVKDVFGIAEEHIGEMSSGVQALLAHVGYDEFTLRRMFNAYGREAAESAFGAKLRAYSENLPKGISIRFVVETTCHFLASLEGGR